MSITTDILKLHLFINLYPVLLSTRVRALKYYKSIVSKSSFEHILTPGTQLFPNPFPSPSKQIPAEPGKEGTAWDIWAKSRDLAAGDSRHFTAFDQPAKIPFPQSSSPGQYSRDVPGTFSWALQQL